MTNNITYHEKRTPTENRVASVWVPHTEFYFEKYDDNKWQWINTKSHDVDEAERARAAEILLYDVQARLVRDDEGATIISVQQHTVEDTDD